MYYAGLYSLLIQVTVETETCSPKGTCWGAAHAESIFLHIKISCRMELAQFFVLALRVYFYKNMKRYFITWPKTSGFFSCKGEKEKMLQKNNVGVHRMNHSMYIFVLAR